MKSITYEEFRQSYFECKKICSTYRFGQHFINVFIKDSEPVGLWEANYVISEKLIGEFIEQNQWDYNNLLVLREENL